MSSEWYYAKAGKKEGPVSIDDLKRLVQQGQLQPTDHVWTQRMQEWVPASTVEGLFGAEPPPLPPSSGDRDQERRPDLDASPVRAFFRWCCDKSIIILSVLLVISLLLTSQHPSPVGHVGGLLLLLSITALIAAVSSIQLEKYNAAHGLLKAGDRKDSSFFNWCYNRPIRCFAILTAFSVDLTGYHPAVVGEIGGVLLLLSLTGLSAAVAVPAFKEWIPRGMREQEKQKKLKLLVGLWEPVSGEGVYFQFTKDGALVRGDGIATRYRWLPENRIELYADEKSPKAVIDVLSLSEMEMVVSADGQGGHFKKGVTVTEAHEEEARQAALATAGAIAGGAAMLALGGLAILGKIAVGTITDAVLDPALGSSSTGIGESFSGGGTSSPSPASGPPATPANTTQQTQQSQPRLRVAALCGAIIVDDDGTLVTYKKKCESCGHVDPGTTRMQIRRGVTSGSFPCTKCGKMQETKIQGT